MTNTLFMRKKLRAGTALQALALLGAGVVVSAAFVAPASAQDFQNINASGRVQGTDGKAIAGATVSITSNDQGFSRTVKTNSSGAYQITQIPTGTYTYTISADGYDAFTDNAVPLTRDNAANQFTLAFTGAAAGGDIVVTAGRQVVADFDRNTIGAVINIGDLAKRVPVTRDLKHIILLAPGTLTGSSAQNSSFAGQAQVSGSSFTENAYYVNGLNITNFRTGFQPVTIPFDFYDSVEVKTGGFQAEYGRATGGVVNAITKSGSNQFHGSVLFSWEPDELHGTEPNSYISDNDGDHYKRNDTTFQLSGPIIKDHLFFYGLANFREVVTQDGSANATDPVTGELDPAGNQSQTQRSTSPFFAGKIDAVIVDGQRLEFTIFDTTSSSYNYFYDYNSDTNKRSTLISDSVTRSGGLNYVGRYTGNFGDFLTVSAAYGKNKFRAGTIPTITDQPRVIDYRGDSAGVDIGPNLSSSVTTNNDQREFYRGDIDLYVHLLGSHHFRFGYDRENLTSVQLAVPTGEGLYSIYRSNGAGDIAGLPAGDQYVGIRTFQNGGSFGSVNEAYYAEDSWSLFGDRLALQLGIRNDQFTNKTAAGDAFYKSGSQWGPRLGATFDVFGNGRTKLNAFYGRYFVPVASNTNIRSAGREFDVTAYYRYNGLDSNNVPILGAPVNSAVNARTCPSGVGDGANCVVTRDGSVQNPDTVIAQGLKPQSEDEYILGLEQRIGQRMTVALNFQYRKLNEVLEDAAIDQAAIAYCQAQADPNNPGSNFSADDCNDIYTGFSQYVLLNPGSGAKIKLIGLPDGSQPTVDFTADQLGYPKAKRHFEAMTFIFNREFDGVWSLNASYQFSKLIGNYEGGAKSDIGQADTGATEDFDQPGFTIGSYGYLPGHREHQFKIYGSYQPFEFMSIGANAVIASPKKFGCIGIVPTSVDPFAAQYQGGGFFCQGKLVPRASAFESDWEKRLDLSVQFQLPTSFDASLRFDVFNVFNSKAALDFDEIGDQPNGAPNTHYKDPLVFEEPRSARIQLRVGF